MTSEAELVASYFRARGKTTQVGVKALSRCAESHQDMPFAHNLITSRKPEDLEDFSEALLRHLETAPRRRRNMQPESRP